MSIAEHKKDIVSDVNKACVDILVNTLALRLSELDSLRAENATLKAQLSPKPEASEGEHGPGA